MIDKFGRSGWPEYLCIAPVDQSLDCNAGSMSGDKPVRAHTRQK